MIEDSLDTGFVFSPFRVGVVRQEHADGWNSLLGEPVGHVAGDFVEVKFLVNLVTRGGAVNFGDSARFRQNSAVTIRSDACPGEPVPKNGGLWWLGLILIFKGFGSCSQKNRSPTAYSFILPSGFGLPVAIKVAVQIHVIAVESAGYLNGW